MKIKATDALLKDHLLINKILDPCTVDNPGFDRFVNLLRTSPREIGRDRVYPASPHFRPGRRRVFPLEYGQIGPDPRPDRRAACPTGFYAHWDNRCHPSDRAPDRGERLRQRAVDPAVFSNGDRTTPGRPIIC